LTKVISGPLSQVKKPIRKNSTPTMAMEVATFGRALAAGTADIRRAPAATAAERGVGEWLGTTLSHSFDGQLRFVNFPRPVNLVLHCATRSERIVLNAPPLSPVQQRFPRETHAHAM
jgi:hypothetical protein